MEADLNNMKDEYSDKLMNSQLEHGKKMLATKYRLKRSKETVEKKDGQIMSTNTSIVMAMNVKIEVIINALFSIEKQKKMFFSLIVHSFTLNLTRFVW